MTYEQYKAEIKYRLSIHILIKMIAEGLITKGEYAQIDTKLNKQWQPLLSDL